MPLSIPTPALTGIGICGLRRWCPGRFPREYHARQEASMKPAPVSRSWQTVGAGRERRAGKPFYPTLEDAVYSRLRHGDHGYAATQIRGHVSIFAGHEKRVGAGLRAVQIGAAGDVSDIFGRGGL